MTEYSLVMPFILCASNGGPYDDEAFVMGYECGQLDALLRVYEKLDAAPDGRFVHTNVLMQLDLICMQHGFRLTEGQVDESGEWTWVSFTPVDE